MKKIINFTFILIAATTVWSCSDSSTDSDSGTEQAPAEKQFVWNAMNYWYFWQEDVPELANNMQFFDSEQAYHDYLMGFQDVEGVFNDLLFSVENFGEGIGEDDFSFFIDDWEAFRQAQQGNTFSFGFEYGLVRFCQECTEVFGYVQYVVEGTPADDAGLTRGDLFTGINGTALNINNFEALLANSTYELTMAASVNGEINKTGETVTLNSTQVVEDPIHISKVLETGSSKVGYLLYNAFQTNSHENLNDVFGNFISEGIDELVLDLRYNGGGAVRTSAVLASMISGLDESEDFAVFSFNSKRAGQNNEEEPFWDQTPLYNENGVEIDRIPMNKLSLDRLYVLTGFGTASASEAVINGLDPFMDVILIGRQTVGKDDASLTLYDTPIDVQAPFTNRNQANPDHKFAIQPIVLKVVNSVGESNGEGFPPHHFVNELGFPFLDDLPPLGDENDPLLARALQEITGAPVAKAQLDTPQFRGEVFKDSRDLQKFGKEMYIVPEQMETSGISEKTREE